MICRHQMRYGALCFGNMDLTGIQFLIVVRTVIQHMIFAAITLKEYMFLASADTPQQSLTVIYTTVGTVAEKFHNIFGGDNRYGISVLSAVQ